MLNAIAHRGPDGEGMWLDPDAGLSLGHRRLAVVDLSEAGAQPMQSRDVRFVIAYNGEIYNAAEIRRGLEDRNPAVRWRGHSDTEVLVELIAAVGLEKALAACDGMFALALWDKAERRLSLARDRFGEKPIYYSWSDAGLIFASELKAFTAVAGFRPEIDPQAVACFFKYGYVPGPLTIWADTYKVEPGCVMTFTAAGVAARKVHARRYWDAAEAAIRLKSHPFVGSTEEAERHAEHLLTRSVSRRLTSDVPLGALLSGGIDSSLVTALMQATGSRPVRTFSVGMADKAYDESVHARAVAKALETDHTELIVAPRDVLDAVPHMASVYDEPFADSSQVPAFLVSRLAGSHVSVALSGDGGDELFGGYNRYIHAPRIWKKVAGLSPPMRRLLGSGLRQIPACGRGLDRLGKLARVLDAQNQEAFHDNLLSLSSDAQTCLAQGAPPLRLVDRVPPGFGNLTFAERAMLLDTTNYLPDDVLTKVDRASMAASLELRTPFLNADVFDFCWSLPHEMKVSGGQGKSILRRILYKHVPQELVDRPKAGFAIPIGRWLRTGLRDWAEEQLSAGRLQRSGILNVREIRRRWQLHLTGRGSEEGLLWSVLMFQGWLDAQGTCGQRARQFQIEMAAQ